MALLGCALIVLALRLALRQLNVLHLRRHGDTVPPEFAGAIDPATLQRSTAYTLARSRLGLIELLVEQGVLLGFLFGGGLGWYDRWTQAAAAGWLTQGLLFAGGLVLAQTLLGLPFDAWHTFVLEQHHGFNTTTVRLWLADLVKGLVLSLLLLGLLLAGVLWLVQLLPGWWWLPVWALLAAFMLLMMLIAPYVIEPLFFQFQPLQREELAEQIRALVAKSGLRVEKILQVDASRRSRHSNAYFTGLGRDKRVVLFDTLLEQMSPRQILAVLAHELGHWRHGDLWRGIATALTTALAGCLFAAWALPQPWLPQLAGALALSVPARLLLLLFAGSLAGFALTPLSSVLSRRRERRADGYAVALTGDAQALAEGLMVLARENLSNLHPHPLHAAFYDSHPPVVARVRRLLALQRRGNS